MLRALMFAGIMGLSLACALNNFQHAKSFGVAVAFGIMCLEFMKPLIVASMVESVNQQHYGRALAALILAFGLVSFSFVNTFGNVLTKHAYEKARLEKATKETARTGYRVLQEVANLQQCPDIPSTRQEQQPLKGGKTRTVTINVMVTDRECIAQRDAKKLALQAEIDTRKQQDDKGEDLVIDKHTVEDGYVALAYLLGFSPSRYSVGMYWTAGLAFILELGVLLGGACIPEGRRKTQTA